MTSGARLTAQRLARMSRCTVLAVSSLVLATFMSGLALQKAYAAADPTFRALNDIITYDPNGSACAPATSTDGPAPTSAAPATGTSGATFSLDQVKSFAREPITSTWNISDSSIEQLFLKQDAGHSAKYGLTSSNIGQITAAVKAANVSPVYFYLYAINEGATSTGGFINHYQSETGGGGPGNAKRDAEYIASQAQKTGDDPAWQDLGVSSGSGNFVPQSVQASGNADFKSMPTGTIGRIYIPATAAAAWEVYYPAGLKGSVNGVQDYGPPLQGMMQNIKKAGGDPMQGGTAAGSGTCSSNAVTGEGMAKGISWARMIANNDGYGYDQPGRETGWAKWQSDPSCTNQCGSFDCSSLISAIITVAGYVSTNPEFVTGNEGSVLKSAGFTQVASSATTSAGLLPGDILITDGHTEMYMGNNQSVGAHINENREAAGGQVGDQTGHEISITPYYDDHWTSVWRAPSK